MIRMLASAASVLLLAAVARAGDPAPNWLGKWHNEMCSEMEIKSVDATTGLVAGTFKTGVGEASKTQVFPLTGYANGDLLTFSVNWGKPDTGKGSDSLTAWAGQHTIARDRELIRTMWDLARNVDNAKEQTDLWAGILAGSDGFLRGEVPPHCTPQP